MSNPSLGILPIVQRCNLTTIVEDTFAACRDANATLTDTTAYAMSCRRFTVRKEASSGSSESHDRSRLDLQSRSPP